MTKLYTIILTMAVLLVTACTSSDDFNEVVGEDNVVYLQTTASFGEKAQSGKAVTRAHWNSNRKFVWDENSDQMAVLIANSEGVVPWGNNGYSYVTVTKMEDTEEGKSLASLKSNSGILKSDLDKLRVGSTPVYFFSPLSTSNGTNSQYSSDTKCVTMSLPNGFTQTEKGRLDEFAPYTYIYAPSVVSAVSKSSIEAVPSVFKGVPAVIHFSVTNEKNTQIKINKVEISLSGGGFPKTMVLDPIHSVLGPLSGTELYQTVTTNLGEEGAGDMVGEHADYYLYVFPTAIVVGETLTSYYPLVDVVGKTLTLSIYEDEGGTPLKVHSVQIVVSNHFLGNHIYTCNLRVQDTSLSLQLDGIEVQTISDWQAGVCGTTSW